MEQAAAEQWSADHCNALLAAAKHTARLVVPPTQHRLVDGTLTAVDARTGDLRGVLAFDRDDGPPLAVPRGPTAPAAEEAFFSPALS